MAKLFRTLRNNWKKSTFAAILGYYGIEYGRNWHKDYLLMREFSKEALVHGKRPLPGGARNKHITLFLNPTAGNRKSKSKLEKYSEPLLHLAGFLVNVVKTERIDEARDLAGVIEKTNIIAVAGGDGTLFETVTGLLRREDVQEAVKRFPIGIIPLGHHNQFAKELFNNETDLPEPKFIAESTMAIVRHKIRPQDVMEITIAEDAVENEAEENVTKVKKPFYSLAGINIGQYREAQKLRNDMPSLFPEYFATFWSLFRTPEQFFKAEIRYIPACQGCFKCTEKIISSPQPEPVVAARKSKVNQPSIWSKVFSVFQPAQVQAQVLQTEETLASNEESMLINPECGNWSSLCVETSELNILPIGNGKLQIEIGGKLQKTDFMIEGLKRFRNEPSNYSQKIDCKEVEIVPFEGQEFLSIDNEEFDMKRIKINCLKDKVFFFSP